MRKLTVLMGFFFVLMSCISVSAFDIPIGEWNAHFSNFTAVYHNGVAQTAGYKPVTGDYSKSIIDLEQIIPKGGGLPVWFPSGTEQIAGLEYGFQLIYVGVDPVSGLDKSWWGPLTVPQSRIDLYQRNPFVWNTGAGFAPQTGPEAVDSGTDDNNPFITGIVAGINDAASSLLIGMHALPHPDQTFPWAGPGPKPIATLVIVGNISTSTGGGDMYAVADSGPYLPNIEHQTLGPAQLPADFYFKFSYNTTPPLYGWQVRSEDPAEFSTQTPQPCVQIIKYTNGSDANDPNGSDVPNIAAGGAITWTYKVTNCGNTSVAKADAIVTDNQPGVTPAFDSELSGNGDNFFDPGEVWLYKATGTALDLSIPQPGVTTVSNVCTHDQTEPPRTAYFNTGKVEIPGASATDPSSYCNPPCNCDDNNACTTDTCNPATGECSHTPISCDDGNACTADSCDPATGCVHTAISCDDGNACTADSCDPAIGCVHTAISCYDGNACTADSCDPKIGCVYTAIPGCCLTDTDCNDNDICTADTCVNNACVHTPDTSNPACQPCLKIDKQISVNCIFFEKEEEHCGCDESKVEYCDKNGDDDKYCGSPVTKSEFCGEREYDITYCNSNGSKDEYCGSYDHHNCDYCNSDLDKEDFCKALCVPEWFDADTKATAVVLNVRPCDDIEHCDYNHDGKCDDQDKDYCDYHKDDCDKQDTEHCDYNHDGKCDDNDLEICDSNHDGKCDYHDKESCYSGSGSYSGSSSYSKTTASYSSTSSSYGGSSYGGSSYGGGSYGGGSYGGGSYGGGSYGGGSYGGGSYGGGNECDNDNDQIVKGAMYRLIVTNCGSVDLSNVKINDPILGITDYTVGNLAAGASVTLTSGEIAQLQTDIQCCSAGEFVNTSTATGSANGSTITDSDSAWLICVECQEDSDCNDGKACTTDTCDQTTHTCSHTPKPNCCTCDSECSDGNACTTDKCDTTTHTCKNTPIAGCKTCTTAADCNDGNSCTTDKCDTTTHTCKNTPIAGCKTCTTTADCNDGNSCTTDKCDTTTHTCKNTPIAGCKTCK